jgi:signal transduction histidine kinase
MNLARRNNASKDEQCCRPALLQVPTRPQASVFECTFERCPYPSAVVDSRKHVLRLNDAFNVLFQIETASVTGLPVGHVLRLADTSWVEGIRNSRRAVRGLVDSRRVYHAALVHHQSLQFSREGGRSIFMVMPLAHLAWPKQGGKQACMTDASYQTGDIVHDLRNFLGIIAGNVQLLSKDVKSSRDRRKLKDAVRACTSAANIANAILQEPHHALQAPEPTSYVSVLRDMKELIGSVCGENIKVVYECARSWPIPVLNYELSACILNAVINAAEAMKGTGLLTISSVPEFITSETRCFYDDLAIGRYSRLSISDTGSGMDLATACSAFNRNFTTKTDRSGRGAGLADIFTFAKRNGGTARIRCGLQPGLTLEILLPCPSGERELSDSFVTTVLDRPEASKSQRKNQLEPRKIQKV